MNATTLARTARRHWLVVCAGTLAGLAGGGWAIMVTPAVYSSSASVLVQAVGSDEINLDTEAQLAGSTDTASVAAGLLRGPGVTVPVTEAQVTVEPLADTSVLIIRYESTTSQGAQAGAQAFAEAYLANRADDAQDAIDNQVKALNQRIKQFEDELAGINDSIGRHTPNSPAMATLRTSATTLTGQITALTTRANELATTTVTPGRVIRRADLPVAPVRPDGWLYLAYGIGAGALAGVVGAWTRDRLSPRVRHGADITQRLGLPLLAQLPGEGTDNGVLSPREPGGRAFNRLRNEVVATLTDRDRIILVTAANPGPASTIVAANLAAALARADNDVVLVGANVPDLAADAMPLSQMFDVGDIPGLTDVLSGRSSLARAVQRAPRAPRLRIVTPGGTASAAGLLQGEAARAVLHALCRPTRYVVVEAPSAAVGADAQSLAGAADAAILVAESGRARFADLADAAVQLRLMGTRLLGAVVVPRVITAPPEEPRLRSMHWARDAQLNADDVWLSDNSRPWVDPPTAALQQVPVPAATLTAAQPIDRLPEGPAERSTDRARTRAETSLAHSDGVSRDDGVSLGDGGHRDDVRSGDGGISEGGGQPQADAQPQP